MSSDDAHEQEGAAQADHLEPGSTLREGITGDRDPFREFSPDPVGGQCRGNFKYRCQTFAESSSVAADGEVHTERFASLDVGENGQGIRESHLAYSSTALGIAKIGLERHLGGRAMKTVTEYDTNTNVERSSEMFKGMVPEDRDAFVRAFCEKVNNMFHARHGQPPGTPAPRGQCSARVVEVSAGISAAGGHAPAAQGEGGPLPATRSKL
mmetsp:Transcript_85005/g.214194  ORF Transcript_85005/g.214194 Transcript_85005/m.214194 type:complete len:210 (-) Transcript_85005:19-648(-)